MTLLETSIAVINGKAKQMTFRNLAGPSDRDSATSGKMNDARIAADHTAAFVAMSVFFSARVILMLLYGRLGFDWSFAASDRFITQGLPDRV